MNMVIIRSDQATDQWVDLGVRERKNVSSTTNTGWLAGRSMVFPVRDTSSTGSSGNLSKDDVSREVGSFITGYYRLSPEKIKEDYTCYQSSATGKVSPAGVKDEPVFPCLLNQLHGK